MQLNTHSHIYIYLYKNIHIYTKYIIYIVVCHKQNSISVVSYRFNHRASFTCIYICIYIYIEICVKCSNSSFEIGIRQNRVSSIKLESQKYTFDKIDYIEQNSNLFKTLH